MRPGSWSFFDGEVTDLLNRLPFVRWDRFTETVNGVEVYGWIVRADGRYDFVALDIHLPALEIGFVTSSATYTRRIAEALYGEKVGDFHVECQRVEERFPDVASKVELDGR
jgi:hypothetical protein